MFKYVLCLCVIVLAGCSATEENQAKPDWAQDIDALIETEDPRRFNGVILITKNGKTQYLKSHGFADFGGQIPLSIDDNFRIQSNSKQITAVLVLREYEKGNISLHNPINEYFPDLEKGWANRVTIHHLLNMSSGIGSLDDDLIFEPGTNYRYSNASYTLLGKILENVTGERYIDLANNLFRELSMKNSFCYEFGGDQKGLINGHIRKSEGYERVDFYSRGITREGWLDFIPAGGIISNATDLNIWDRKLHDGEILDAETYKLMTDFNIRGRHAAFGDEEIGYGFGVRIDDSKESSIIGHAGKGIGFANIKFYVPSSGLSVIILENVYDDDPDIVYHFEKEILDVVMKSSLVE